MALAEDVSAAAAVKSKKRNPLDDQNSERVVLSVETQKLGTKQ